MNIKRFTEEEINEIKGMYDKYMNRYFPLYIAKGYAKFIGSDKG